MKSSLPDSTVFMRDAFIVAVQHANEMFAAFLEEAEKVRALSLEVVSLRDKIRTMEKERENA